VTINVVSTSATRITLFINIPATAIAGPLQLTITDALKQTATVEINIGERRAARVGPASSGVPPEADSANMQKNQKKPETPPVSGRAAPSPPPPSPVSQGLHVIGDITWAARTSERLRATGAGGQR
jgi:hypothetical protein